MSAFNSESFDPSAYVRQRNAARKNPKLSGPGQVRRSDPQTSRDAASINRRTQRARVLEVLLFDDLVATEIAKRLNLVRDSVTPRLGELQKHGWMLDGQPCALIEPTGQTKPGPHGGNEQVYRLTGAGHDLVTRWRSPIPQRSDDA